jgi:hypothetical protein
MSKARSRRTGGEPATAAGAELAGREHEHPHNGGPRRGSKPAEPFRFVLQRRYDGRMRPYWLVLTNAADHQISIETRDLLNYPKFRAKMLDEFGVLLAHLTPARWSEIVGEAVAGVP